MIPVRDLEELSVHEAAHAVAGILFGRRVSLLRITRNQVGAACCQWADTERPAVRSGLEPMYATPAFRLPAELRSRIERDIIVSIAPEEAIRLWRHRPAVALS